MNESYRDEELMPHLDSLLNIAGWLTMRRTQAEDLVTATMLTAYHSRRTNNGTAPARIRLLRLLVRTYFSDEQFESLPDRDSLTGEPTEPMSSEPMSPQDLDFEIDADNLPRLLSMDAASVRASVARLRPLFRLIMVLHYCERCSYADIAVITDLQEHAVKVHLRLIRRLIPRRLLAEATRSATLISPTTPTSRSSEGWQASGLPNTYGREEIEGWDNEGGAVAGPGKG